MNGKFFRCSNCGNVIYLMNGDINNVRCCEKKMDELVPGSVDASSEKHVPEAYDINGRLDIQVGSVIHPMLEKHYIEWIAVENEDGNMHIKYLKPGDEPKVSFCNHHRKIHRIYAYCNIHGLWAKDL